MDILRLKIDSLIDDYRLLKIDLSREIGLFFDCIMNGQTEVSFGSIVMSRNGDGERIVVHDGMSYRYLDSCSVDELVRYYEEYFRS